MATPSEQSPAGHNMRQHMATPSEKSPAGHNQSSKQIRVATGGRMETFQYKTDGKYFVKISFNLCNHSNLPTATSALLGR
jgi:hypothetical protein